MVSVKFKGDFCQIKGFKPGVRTKEGIERINNIIDMSSVLESFVISIPIFQVFSGRETLPLISYASIGYNVETYEWQLFADSVKGINSIKRRRLENIADEIALYSTGKEYEFWRCISNAF